MIDNDQGLNTYNVLFPSFTFTQPTALNNALVGSTYNRSFTITNGAAGVSQNIYLQIISPVSSILLNSLSLNGFGILTPSAVNGDTLFFTITPSMLGADGLFIETHPDPANAKSDGANMLHLDNLEKLLVDLVRIREAIS